MDTWLNNCGIDNVIIRGTTPTIKFTFNKVCAEDIEVAYLTIKMNNEVLIEKDIDTATIGDRYLSWILTQEDSLSMTGDSVVCQLNWKLFNGTRGASEKVILKIASNEKEVVI